MTLSNQRRFSFKRLKPARMVPARVIGYETSGSFVSKTPCAYNRVSLMTLTSLKIQNKIILFNSLPFQECLSRSIMTELSLFRWD